MRISHFPRSEGFTPGWEERVGSVTRSGAQESGKEDVVGVIVHDGCGGDEDGKHAVERVKIEACHITHSACTE